MTERQAQADRLTAWGFTVFPCDGKVPKVPKGSDWRTPPEGGWLFLDSDNIGVAMPEGTVALDIDNKELFAAAGLDIGDASVYQGTLKNGLHIFYRTDGRTVAQVTQGVTLGYDTRVGGKGYVIAWQPERWVDPKKWPPAPEWLYQGKERAEKAPRDPDAPMGTRVDILRWLGILARQGGLTAADYLAMLQARVSDGRIVALDPARPWTKADLKTLAAEAAEWEPAVEDVATLILDAKPTAKDAQPSRQVAESEKEMDAADLLDLDLPPLVWRIPGLLTEGMALLAAPPKTGKSVFAYQLAVELVLGGSIMGIETPRCRVLYYALEDGRRRSQARVRSMLRGRRLPANQFLLRWTTPSLGDGLEQQVHEWLTANPASLVIIDVLAKVRPAGKGKALNAYDEDYAGLTSLHRVANLHPGSTILVVTHDRKAGSDDWVTRVTGTRGVTGAADSVLFINRKRGEDFAKLVATGRDQEDASYDVQFVKGPDGAPRWEPADMRQVIEGMASAQRQAVFNWLAEHGPAWQLKIAEGTGMKHDNVKHIVEDMFKDGQLVVDPDRLGYRVPVAHGEDDGEEAD